MTDLKGNESLKKILPFSNVSLQVSNLGKRYNREWIFRDLNYSFESGKSYAISGPNGSGKSTLLQILCGQLPPSKGTLEYFIGSIKTPVEDIYKEVSIAAPYVDLIEEFTLCELIHFHFSLRKIKSGLKSSEILDLLELGHAGHKQIGNFSSGMRQRVKLGLALFTECHFLFLDEPSTNLDALSFDWYIKHLNQRSKDCTLFIASNIPEEYASTTHLINISEFK